MSAGPPGCFVSVAEQSRSAFSVPTNTKTEPRHSFYVHHHITAMASIGGRRGAASRLSLPNIPTPSRDSSPSGTSSAFAGKPLHPLPLPPARKEAVQDISQLEKMEVLGHGSGGIVYKVRHRKTGDVYALKVINGDHEETVRQQIIREMEILRKTDSPFVVKCHGIFDRGNAIHFVLEYMDGGSLEMYKKRAARAGGSGLSEAFLAEAARQVLQGLRYLHEKKIVHRDIKPSNLLVNRKNQIKIADFGVSRILSQTLDPCNTYVGTCAYMSPERFDPESYGGGNGYNGYAGDIWSLGLSLLECFTGHFPFLEPGQKADWPSLMCAICYGEPPTPPPYASPAFRDFISCCMQKDASKRWTARSLLSHPFVAGQSSSGARLDLSRSMKSLCL